MPKRLGKRERAKLRAAQAAKRELVRQNLASTPERGLLSSPTARDRLRSHSHTGFRDPKGNLAKSRVTDRPHFGAFRYVVVRLSDGACMGGSDNKRKAEELAKHMRERYAIELRQAVKLAVQERG